MNVLDKALLAFWACNDGKAPSRIYIGWNNLREILISDRYFQLDKANRLYIGILYFLVQHDDNHLAIY